MLTHLESPTDATVSVFALSSAMVAVEPAPGPMNGWSGDFLRGVRCGGGD